MARRDKTQGFVFQVNDQWVSFNKDVDMMKEKVPSSTIRAEIEKVLAEAFEALDMDKDSDDVLDFISIEIDYLKKNR